MGRMVSADFSILIIGEDPLRAGLIESALSEAGHRRITVLGDVRHCGGKIAAIAPDAIVIDLGDPARGLLEEMFQVSRAVRRPVAMFVDRTERDLTEAAIEAGIGAYIVDGLKKERVKPVLDMAVSRFGLYSRMERELEDARDELRERKTVERAKGILMNSKNLSEAEAYALLRRTAMNQNRKIGEVAESLILAAGLLE